MEDDKRGAETEKPEEELEDLTPEKDATGGRRGQNPAGNAAPDAQKRELE